MASSWAPIPYWRLSSFYFFYFALVGVMLPFWTLYLQALGYSPQEIGVISGVLMVTRLLAPNIWGWLADQGGNRLGLVRWGSFAACLCFAAILVSTRYQWLLWVVATFSFFWNAVLAQFEVLTLAHIAPRTHRYGLIRQWGSLGFIVAVVALGYLFDWVDILHLPLLVFSLLVLIWLSSLSVPDTKTLEPFSDGISAWRNLLRPRVWLFFLACFLLQVSHGPYYTFYSIYLQELGYSAGTIGWLWALGVIAEIVLFWLVYKLLAKVSLTNLLIIAFALTALRWYLIGSFAGAWYWLFLAQLLHGASFGLAHAVAIEWVGRDFPGRTQGQGQAFYSSLSFGGGGAFGAVLSGFYWADFGAATFWAASGFAVSGLFIAIWLRISRIRD